MEENLLQYVWQQRLFPVTGLLTTDGHRLEVIHVGSLNHDSGPDFFNAKIKLDGTLWVGNVEVHVRASDWKRHRHQYDRAYDNVILHVVFENDARINRSDGSPIPQVVLPVAQKVQDDYASLMSSRRWIPCADRIQSVDPIFVHAWMDSCLVERLERKTKSILSLLNKTRNDWENAFYVTFARAFGFGLNADVFEALAQSLPFSYIAKHRSSRFQVEAILFGQSGLMELVEYEDDYLQNLQSEYAFLRQKFSLRPLDADRWRMLRLRLQNFPHVRIAQFAAVLCASDRSLFSEVLQHHSVSEMLDFFENCDVSDYWKSHYLFGTESPVSKKNLGQTAVRHLIINAVVPVLFAYGKAMNDSNRSDEALKILENLPPEANHIVRGWKALAVEAENAAHTQALIQWKTNYCDRRDCLRCQIGRRLM